MSEQVATVQGAAAQPHGIAEPDRAVRVGRDSEQVGPMAPGLGDVLSQDDLGQYGRVAAKLLQAGESEPFTLAVTSSVAEEGVSTVCVGLAQALAISTMKSVVLLDANLRRPALHRLLGLPDQPGFREVVASGESHQWGPDSTEYFGALSRTALPTSVPNLWLVPSGAEVGNPAQLTTSSSARSAVQSLRMRFDFVVIDCPPVLSAIDAAPICRFANAVALVVRAGLTPRDDVARARELLRGSVFLGAILNGV